MMGNDRIGITLELTKKQQFIIKHLAIDRGVTYDEMLEKLFSESESSQEIYIEQNRESLIIKMETEEEFNKRFRRTLQHDDTKHIFSEYEILALKEAYYYFQMAENARVPIATPHDKKRYNKYKNAIDTIEEMLNISNHADKEELLKPIRETYNIFIQSKKDLKKDYTDKMNEKIDKLKFSNYRKKDIIDTFKNDL